MSLVLGVDVGSQSIKAVIVDDGGDVVSAGSAPLTMTHEHDGWADQDPHAYCTALRDAVRAATEGVQADRVVAMGLGSQVDGVVACDADGTPLRPAIIWLDKRATEQCDRLVSAVGSERLSERTGLVADASHSAPKMMWIRENETRIWQQAAVLAPVGSFVLHHLCGSHAQDPANASSTMVYDVARGDFDTELCEAAGLDPAMLPPVRPSTDVVGTLRPDVAAELGLTTRCAVVVGTGDEHAASVGAGAIESGVVVDVTGTAEPVTTVAAAPVRDPLGVVETHGHAVPGSWLIENPGFVSGGSTLWLANGLLAIPQGEVFALARQAPPASDGVLFLPALSGSTAPRWNDAMRGAFLGLAMNHTQAHVARAVLEGCAYALRDIVDRLDALGLGHGEVRIVGGGARDDLWAAIKADVLGRPVRRVLTQEATAVGAAMVAGVGAGVFASFDAASVAVHLDQDTIEPDAAAQRQYAEAYCRYRAAFDAVESALASPLITVPEPRALLAELRDRGHGDLPDVDIRVGAAVLDGAIADAREHAGVSAPVILSDGGPYRTPAGPVVDRLAKRFGDCPVIQLGTGTVRADEETVERAVAEVGPDRLLVSVGAGTLTDIAKVTAQRTGSRHVAVQTACSINGFIADRSVLIIAGAKRTVVSRWPDMLVADTDILSAAPAKLNLAGVGDLSTVPNAVAEWQFAARLGHGPAYDPAVVDDVLAAMPTLPTLARAARDAEPAGLADLARLLAASGLSMGIVGSTAPASGSEHAVSHLLEMALARKRQPAAPHGMQVTVATRLALRVWQLVNSAIRSTRAHIGVPDESASREAVERAFAELGEKTVEECWTAYSAKRNWLLAHRSDVEAVVADWDSFTATLTLPTPEQFHAVSHASGLPTRAEDLGAGYDDRLLFWALRNSQLLRERISIVDLADLLGVWSDETARSIVADSEQG